MIDEWGKGAKYWNKAWNPVIGCRKVSEGCANCYAEGMAERFPELQDSSGGFTPHCPTTTKRPPRTGVVFVGNMTDIFGEWNSEEQITDWLGSLSMRAVNLVLTKRPERFGEIYPTGCFNLSINLGTTAENQDRYNIRIKELRNLYQMGFAWLSLEPLLGPIDMQLQSIAPEDLPFDWVVVGAESGPNRRPCKLEWVESIVRQCRKAGIKVFVKQLDIDGELVKDIAKFPPELQIRQVPWNAEGAKYEK